jgi:hypothetical protein
MRKQEDTVHTTHLMGQDEMFQHQLQEVEEYGIHAIEIMKSS